MITSLLNRQVYAGTGTTGPFGFTFKIFNPATDLKLTKLAADGVTETPFAYLTDYTVVGIKVGVDAYGGGGTITMNAVVAAGETLVIRRTPPNIQGLSVQNAGPFFPKGYEDQLDYLVMLVQAHEDTLSRVLQMKETTDLTTGISPALPVPSAGLLLGWDPTGKKVVNTPGTPGPAGPSIQTFASAAARNTGFPAPGSNQIVRRSDTGVEERWDQTSGAWLPEGVTRAAGPIIGSKAKGAKADGLTDDSPALTAVSAGIVGGVGIGELDPGTHLVSTNLTLAGHYRPLRGHRLKVGAGKNVFFSGSVEAVPYQWIDTSGGGTVSFGELTHAHARWTGAKIDDPGDGTGTDDTAALQALEDMLPAKAKLLWPTTGSFAKMTQPLRIWTKREQVWELDAHGSMYPDTHSGIYYAGPEGTAAIQIYNSFGITWRGIKVIFNNGANVAQVGFDVDQFPDGTIIGGRAIVGSVTSDNRIEELCLTSANNSIRSVGVRYAFTSTQNVERQSCTRVMVSFQQSFNAASNPNRGMAFQIGCQTTFGLTAPLVTGAAGAGTINITGAGGSGTLKAGICFFIAGDHTLYTVTADSVVAAGGTTATAITPNLQTSPVAAAVTILLGGANAKNIRLRDCDSVGAANFLNAAAGSVLVEDAETQWSNVDFVTSSVIGTIMRVRSENGRQFLTGSGTLTLITNEIQFGGWDAAFPNIRVVGTTKLVMIGNNYDDQGGAPVNVDADPASNAMFVGIGNHYSNGSPPGFANFSQGAVDIAGAQGLGMLLGGGTSAPQGLPLRFGSSTQRANLVFTSFGDGTFQWCGDAMPGCDDLLGVGSDGSGSGPGALVYKHGTKWASLGSNQFKILDYIKGGGGYVAPLSPADSARLYYSDVLGKLKISENGGAYVHLVPLRGSKTFDWPNLLTATQQSTTVTVTGAALGDAVTVGHSTALGGTRLWGEVTAADTVTVYQRNDTGGAVDVTSGTLTAVVQHA